MLNTSDSDTKHGQRISSKYKKTLLNISYFDSFTIKMHDVIFYFLYFIARHLILIVSYCLCIIASLYAVGSLVELKARNCFCPWYSLQQVQDCNKQHEYERGDGNSCYYVFLIEDCKQYFILEMHSSVLMIGTDNFSRICAFNWLSLIKTNCHKLRFIFNLSTAQGITNIFLHW